jgi:hypothetical protein
MTKIVPKQFLILLPVILLSLSVIVCIALGPLNGLRIKQESLQATAEAETALTNTYGREVSDAIENFESQWHSVTHHSRNVLNYVELCASEHLCLY